MFAKNDTEFLSTCSDVVKSWDGFRPTGAYLDTFTHDMTTGDPLTSSEAHRRLTEWVNLCVKDENSRVLEKAMVKREEAEMREWEDRVDAEIAATSWLFSAEVRK